MSSLVALKALVGATCAPTERKFFHFSQIPQGIPQGVIAEVCGLGKTEFVVKLLRENSHLKAAWVEREVTLNPCAFVQKGVSLDNVLFVEPGEYDVWVLLQLLNSQLFPIVICQTVSDEKLLRRLMLTCEKSGSTVLMLSAHFQKSWTIKMQIEVARMGFTSEIRSQVKKTSFFVV
jgi:hypothetical protein